MFLISIFIELVFYNTNKHSTRKVIMILRVLCLLHRRAAMCCERDWQLLNYRVFLGLNTISLTAWTRQAYFFIIIY